MYVCIYKRGCLNTQTHEKNRNNFQFRLFTENRQTITGSNRKRESVCVCVCGDLPRKEAGSGTSIDWTSSIHRKPCHQTRGRKEGESALSSTPVPNTHQLTSSLEQE